MSAVEATFEFIATHDTGDEIVWGVGWGDLLGGIVAGLIGAAIVGAFAWWRRRRRDRADFGSLAGSYAVTEKQPSQRAEGTVTVTGDGPLLSFEWTTADGSQAHGTLAMNEHSRVTGTGSYEQVRGLNHGWGYLTVYVASREQGAARLLVDGRYTRQANRDEVSTAWVWEMTG